MMLASGAYCVLLLLLGYAVYCAIEGPLRESAWQLLGWSAALGAGAMGLLLFWISLLGAAPSRAVLAAVAVAAAVALAALARARRLVRPVLRPAGIAKRDWVALVPALIVASLLAVVAAHALRSPGSEWDDWAIWGLKAKVVAHEPLAAHPAYFHDLSLSYSHLDYPLLVPFLNAGAYAAGGRADARAAAALLPFIYGALALSAYGALRWRLDRTRAAAVAAILAATPAAVRWAWAGVADVPLTLFYAAGIHFAIRWSCERRRRDLALAVLFAVFMAFTKAEGLPLAAITAAVLAILAGRPRRALASAGAFAAGFLLLDLPWLLWSRGLPHTHEDYASKIAPSVIAGNLPRLTREVIPAMAAQIAGFDAWGLLWALPLAMAVSGWRGFLRPHIRGLWMLLLLHLALIALVYTVTPWDLRALFATSLDRVLLHAAPPAAFLAGYHWVETGRARSRLEEGS